MTFEALLKLYPALSALSEHMPEEIKRTFWLKTYPPHSIIHQKDAVLTCFGVVLKGRHRVINEIENGNIFMIEKNEALSFIGEVTLLAGYDQSSVTIETITECVVMFMTIQQFYTWIERDIDLLRLLATGISRKLYSASYSRGERQYYSVRYIVLKYLVEYCQTRLQSGEVSAVRLEKTREEISEELGLTTKTLNRTIKQLKDNNLLSIDKGKLLLTTRHLDRMKRAARQYQQEGKQVSDLR